MSLHLFSLAIMGLCVYIGYLILGPLVDGRSAVDAINSRMTQSLAQTAITTASIFCGLLLIVFVEPRHSLEWKHMVLMLVLAAAFSVVAADPRLRNVFELQPLSLIDYLVLLVVVAIWSLALRWAWRRHLVDTLLGSTSPIPPTL